MARGTRGCSGYGGILRVSVSSCYRTGLPEQVPPAVAEGSPVLLVLRRSLIVLVRRPIQVLQRY
jgi:hypothetical protein